MKKKANIGKYAQNIDFLSFAHRRAQTLNPQIPTTRPFPRLAPLLNQIFPKKKPILKNRVISDLPPKRKPTYPNRRIRRGAAPTWPHPAYKSSRLPPSGSLFHSTRVEVSVAAGSVVRRSSEKCRRLRCP